MRLGSNLIIYTAPLITGAQLKKNITHSIATKC